MINFFGWNGGRGLSEQDFPGFLGPKTATRGVRVQTARPSWRLTSGLGEVQQQLARICKALQDRPLVHELLVTLNSLNEAPRMAGSRIYDIQLTAYVYISNNDYLCWLEYGGILIIT